MIFNKILDTEMLVYQNINIQNRELFELGIIINSEHEIKRSTRSLT